MNTVPERVDVPILLVQEHPEAFSGVRIVLADLGAVVIEVTSIDEAYERVVASDVRYRFVIDMEKLAA